MAARERLPVVLVDQAQALERQVGVDLVDQVAVGGHHAPHAAGRDHARIAAQLLLDIRDHAGQRAHIAAHRARLHGLHGRFADGVLGPLNVHARQLGRLEEQRLHCDLEAREDRAALIRAVLVDRVKGGRSANVHNDERLAVFFHRTDCVDQTVRADLARVGVFVLNADIHIAPRDQRLHAQVFADRVDQRIHHRRHDRCDDHRAGLRAVDAVEVVILRDQHPQLVRGALGVGRDAERTAQLVPFI